MSTVPISILLHNNSQAYLQEGYGGQPIDVWPFYTFIIKYISGQTDEARSEWTDWLVEQFGRYKYWDKDSGGMFGGSVHKGASNFFSRTNNNELIDPNSLSSDNIRKGAEMLVDRRLSMFDSIRTTGYHPSLGSKVLGVIQPDRYIVLKSGHHRAATLRALGYENMPEVKVISSIRFRFKQAWRQVKRFKA